MPERKYEKAGGAPDQPTGKSRRALLNTIWIALGGVVVAEIVWLVAAFLSSPKLTAAPNRSVDPFDAGSTEQFTPNTVTTFAQGRFYLACLEDGGFLALSRRCTHLGCTLPWDPDKGTFSCPCHASEFNIRGEVIRSPASRPLDIFAVSIENKRIKVDVAKTIRRRSFRQGQVASR